MDNSLNYLIKIYHALIDLKAISGEEKTQLSKQLHIIGSMKLYVENLTIFNNCEMLLDPLVALHFSKISEKWITKRQQHGVATTKTNTAAGGNIANVDADVIYLIDCLFEECRFFANMTQIFVDDYPPKTLVVI